MLHNQLCDAIATFSGKKGLITLEQSTNIRHSGRLRPAVEVAQAVTDIKSSWIRHDIFRPARRSRKNITLFRTRA